MPRYTLKYSEMAWWLIDSVSAPGYDKTMIGNARDVSLMRDGLDVLITTETIGCSDAIIPSDTIVRGFGNSKDFRSLHDLTDVGCIYNRALNPIDP